MTLTYTDRLAGCALVRTRFRGRAELEREALRSEVALARLEVRLGLAPESAIRDAERAEIDEWLLYQIRHSRSEHERLILVGITLGAWPAREEQAAREYPRRPKTDFRHEIARRINPAACDAIDQLRLERRIRHESRPDQLARRRPGHVERVIARRRAEELIASARFREAAHEHNTEIKVVKRGHEGASSASDQIGSHAAGMSAAYCRVAYSVTCSEHHWNVSPAILSPATRALNATERHYGVIYLTPVLRVVQGRGTSLRVEHRGPRGGWS